MNRKKDTSIQLRKNDHIQINLEKDVNSSISNGLENYFFNHQALPEVNLHDVDLQSELFGKPLLAPLLISSMTGGTADAGVINSNLAKAAQLHGIAMGVGSQRAAIENKSLDKSFQVRQFAPDIILFANLGAIQLNYGYGLDECKRAVDMIEADALILHLNPLQEALQPEGNTNFFGLLKKIETLCKMLPVPVIVKEVGWGISGKIAKSLFESGVSAIDIAGAGGTSWSEVEKHRIIDSNRSLIASNFKGWGIPTAESIAMVRKNAPNALIFASGGLRNGIDVAKCLALGARLGGIAGPFLRSAHLGLDDLSAQIQRVIDEIKICMFCCGISSLDQFDESLLCYRK